MCDGVMGVACEKYNKLAIILLISKLLRFSLSLSLSYLFVKLNGFLVVSQEIVRVAKVTECPALSIIISQLTYDLQISSAMM